MEKHIVDIPQLKNEWDYEKNKGLDIETLTGGSGKKVWWICPKGHSYQSKISSRYKLHTGCPQCRGKAKALKRISEVPELKKEWDYKKNNDLGLDIEKISGGSDKPAWWICPKGHSYLARVGSRYRLKSGCPYCSNKKTLVGFNDIATTRKDLLEIWNYKRNTTVAPTDLVAVSGRKVWWICPKGHEWEATVAHITNGRRCPVCSRETSSSFPEQAFLYYLGQIDNSVMSRYKYLSKYEIDIFSPDKNVGIEYDGYRWHNNRKKDKLDSNKDSILKDAGILLYRVKEVVKKDMVIDGFIDDAENHIYTYNNDNIPALEQIVKDIIAKIYGRSIDVNIERDRRKIYERYIFEEKQNSVATRDDLLKMWDYEKNGSLEPAFIKLHSEKKIWWICENNHSFCATAHAMSDGLECQECKKERIRNNSLAIIRPEIAGEWDYEKNTPLTPYDVLPASQKKVWWICPKGHEWECIISARTRDYGFCNCPVCSNRRIITGVNDLFTLKPELEKEWDYSKNKKLDPKVIGIGSMKRAWWKCSKCGYEWETKVRLRSMLGCGCKKCSTEIAAKKFTEFMLNNGSRISENNMLMSAWNYNKNKSLDPEKIVKNSKVVAWWKCSKCGKDFQRSVANANKSTQCYDCGREQRLESFRKTIKNRMKTISDSDELAPLWDYKNNKGLDPSEISKWSDQKVWWICPGCGKSFQRSAENMHHRIPCNDCLREQRSNARLKPSD